MTKLPFILESDLVMYVDIDDTLVRWECSQEEKEKYGIQFDHFGEMVTLVPHRKHIRIIKNSKARGHKIIFWSAGGWDWCKQVVIKLGLLGYADAIQSKPRWYMDDLRSHEFMPDSARIWKNDDEE